MSARLMVNDLWGILDLRWLYHFKLVAIIPARPPQRRSDDDQIPIQAGNRMVNAWGVERGHRGGAR